MLPVGLLCLWSAHMWMRGEPGLLWKGPHTHTNEFPPVKGINGTKVLLWLSVVSAWGCGTLRMHKHRFIYKGIFAGLWKTLIFLLNINGSLTQRQSELQNNAYNKDLCIKCNWSLIFIILMCFWCSDFRGAAARQHQKQLWTHACVCMSLQTRLMYDTWIRALHDWVQAVSGASQGIGGFGASCSQEAAAELLCVICRNFAVLSVENWSIPSL